MKKNEALNLLLDLSVANGRLSQAMEEIEHAITQSDEERDLLEENEEEILDTIGEADRKLVEILEDYSEG